MNQYLETKPRGTEGFRFAHYDHHTPSPRISLHWHPEIELLYGVSGRLSVSAGEEVLTLNTGEILFINPEELHTFTVLEEHTHYHAAVFDLSLFRFQSPHFFEQTIVVPLENGSLKLPRLIEAAHPNYRTLRAIVHRLFCDDAGSNALIFSDLTALFAALSEFGLLTRVEHTETKSADIKQCIKYMEAHLNEKITLEELSALVHLSPNYFCSYFKNHTGVTPFAHLHHLRLTRAARRLQTDDTPISVIAEECGFESVSFFIRKFKEQYHCTPSAYRKQVTA